MSSTNEDYLATAAAIIGCKVCELNPSLMSYLGTVAVRAKAVEGGLHRQIIALAITTWEQLQSVRLSVARTRGIGAHY